MDQQTAEPAEPAEPAESIFFIYIKYKNIYEKYRFRRFRGLLILTFNTLISPLSNKAPLFMRPEIKQTPRGLIELLRWVIIIPLLNDRYGS